MQTKKLLGSTLALGMLFPTFASAELVKGLKVGGQLDVQAISSRNVKDFATNQGPTAVTNNDRIGDAQTRIMLSADWDVLDDVHAKVTLRKNDRTWGTNGGSAQVAPTNSQPLMPTGGTDVLGNIFVDQAYVKVDKVGGAVDATIGRQFYGTSGDLVVYYGPSDKMLYGLPVQALDALRVDWAGSWGGLTGVAGKITGSKLNVTGNDKDLVGLNAAIKGTDMVSGAAYVYDQTTHGTGALGAGGAATLASGGKNDNLWVAGVKAKAQMGMGWISAEFAKNFGENRAFLAGPAVWNSRHYTGWAAKIDAGAKVETPIGGVSPWLNIGYGSGDSDTNSTDNRGFVSINGDYRPGTIYGMFNSAYSPTALGSAVNAAGTNPVAGNGSLTNRAIWGVGVKTTPTAMNKLTAGVSFWDFHTQTTALPVTTGAARPFSGNKHIGSEVDIDLAWQHSENVTFGAGVADFQPGGLIKEGNTNTNVDTAGISNPATLVYGDVRIKF